ncbi:hypothetical protein [Paenibacillus illinoisensis]|uniref:hypothetical protein n=2 Tax=Paenibacillus illinoisensis TaxID=59845 RepID=UPI00301E5AAA
MPKRILILICCFTMIFGSFPFYTMAKGNDKYNIELALNPKETDSFLWSDALKEGNEHYLNDDFKNSDKTDGSAKLKFSIDEIDETSVHIIGEGKIKVKSIEKFKFLMDGELTKYTVNNQTVYFGPVIAEAKNEKNIDIDTVITLFIDPQTEKVYVTETYGTLQSDNGVGILAFGEVPSSYLELKDQIISDMENSDEQKVASSTPSKFNSNFWTGVAHAETLKIDSASTFNYKTSFMTQAIGKTGTATGTPSSFPAAKYATLGVNIYTRERPQAGNGSSMIETRLWSNTPAVEEYLKATEDNMYGTEVMTAYLDMFVVGAGNSSLLINYRKDLSYPLDSTPVKAIQIPILKGYLKKAYNLLATTWAAYQNATLGVTTTTIDSNVMSSWKAYAERKIRSTTGNGAIAKKADLPSKTAGVTSSADLDGGTAAYFFFEEQTDGTNKMFIKAKAVYLCNIGKSLAFFVTPKIETYYSHEF